MIRLAHFSDIHVSAEPLGWERRDWFNKRLPGWINLRWLGRGRHFQAADAVVAALVAELGERRLDHVVFSGDASALGFEAEIARAAELLRLHDPDRPEKTGPGAPGPGFWGGVGGLAVPGNHDYYTRASVKEGNFERYFAAWQAGERIDGAVYPFAQRVGPLWLVAVNSCTGNRWTWDASGRVDRAQLDRLDKLLARLEPGPRVLVTHYPICLAGGQREPRSHGLRNLADLVAVAARGGVGLWLHGHRHGAYYLSQPGVAPFPVICVGSATQSGFWSYNEYAIDGRHVQATRRRYVLEEHRFRDSETSDLQMA